MARVSLVLLLLLVIILVFVVEAAAEIVVCIACFEFWCALRDGTGRVQKRAFGLWVLVVVVIFPMAEFPTAPITPLRGPCFVYTQYMHVLFGDLEEAGDPPGSSTSARPVANCPNLVVIKEPFVLRIAEFCQSQSQFSIHT